MKTKPVSIRPLLWLLWVPLAPLCVACGGGDAMFGGGGDDDDAASSADERGAGGYAAIDDDDASPGGPAAMGDGDLSGDFGDGLQTGDDLVEPPDPAPACPAEAKEYFISADDSNSQTSPVLLRDWIENHSSYSYYAPFALRTYEFLNYYDVSYEPAEPGTLRVVPQLRADKTADGQYKLQIGVQAPAMSNFDRPLLNVVFSVDTSGSMAGRGLEMTKAVLRALAKNFKPGDIVSIVEWSDQRSVPLDSYKVDGRDDAHFLNAVNGLASRGSTDLHAGLVTAYDLAARNFSKSRLNRVVLVSDGGANTGVTDIGIIAGAADKAEDEAIFMVGVGAGDYYNDELMDRVTDAGKGAAMYIDSAGEAARMFGDRFTQNMMVAAADVRVSLTLPAGWDVVKFHGEEISADPREVKPQNIAPNDAMVFHQVVAACDPARVDGAEPFLIHVQYTDLATRERKMAAAEATLQELLDADASQLLKGEAVVAYAEAAKFVYGGAYGSDGVDKCQEFIDAVETAHAALPADPALEEIDRLGRKMCSEHVR